MRGRGKFGRAGATGGHGWDEDEVSHGFSPDFVGVCWAEHGVFNDVVWLNLDYRNIYDILQPLLGGFTLIWKLLYAYNHDTNKVRGSIYVYIVRTIPFLCLQLQGWAKGLRPRYLGDGFHFSFRKIPQRNSNHKTSGSSIFLLLERIESHHPQFPQIILHNSYSFIFS